MALLQITEPGQSRDPHQRKHAAGIDLGTTNSLIAAVRAGETNTLPDFGGEHLLPSVVRYHADGSVTVGTKALASAKEDPLNTIISVKRLMGRGLEDVKTLGNQMPYDFVVKNAGEGGESNGMPGINVVCGVVSPVEVSAEILRNLAHRAEATLAGPIDGVVITVPAYFDDAQRQATKDAAQLAHLNVLRLLNEPTAAAVAYGLDTAAEGVIAVYDLGGGTFDISLLRLNRGVFEVLSTGGNSALGGDDFDREIATWLIEASGNEGQISKKQSRGLMIEARGIKEALSDQLSVDVDLDIDGLVVKATITRDIFNKLIKAPVAESIKACRRAVRDAGVSLEEIAHVVMVGGSTRVPVVREKVAAYFKSELLSDIDPDRVVAIGAAIQANILIGNDSEDEVLLLDVLPLSLGLETMGGLTEKIIPRNTAIPVAKAQEFTTYKDGQTAMLIHIVQGERELVTDCRSLAQFELRGIPPMVAGAAKIQVLFQVDADGILSVSAKEMSTGIETHIEVKPSYGLTEDEITTMLKASFEFAEADVVTRSITEAKVDAERVVDAVINAMAKDAERLLSPAEISALDAVIVEVREILAKSEKSSEIIAATEYLAKASDDFASKRMDDSVHKALAGSSIDELGLEEKGLEANSHS